MSGKRVTYTPIREAILDQIHAYLHTDDAREQGLKTIGDFIARASIEYFKNRHLPFDESALQDPDA